MIPVNEPLLDGREKELLAQCIDTGWVSSDGPFVAEFENAFASYIGTRHGVAVANGTAALDIAVRALDLGPGDEVIVPTFTIISCASSIVNAGATPVLVDSEPETWNMDVSQLESKLTSRTKAIMPVHIYGHPVEMDTVLDFAQANGLKVIEDAAEVHGAEYHGRKAGSMGHLNCFSFYANKIITTGEGGMVVTDDDELAERCRSLRNLCFQPQQRFLHEELGFNYRMTNLQAAIGVAQVERIDEFIAIKRRNAALYTERLKDIAGLQLPAERDGIKNVYWMYGVVVDESHGMDAVAFAQALRERGVATRPFFLGMHEQPVFLKRGLFGGESYPVAHRIARQGLYLPSGLTLTETQIDQVCEAVSDVLGGGSR